MTLSPRLPSGLACGTAGSGPAGAELSRMTELALSRGARSVAIGRGRDYSDVPPVKGIYAGNAENTMGVSVRITRVH